MIPEHVLSGFWEAGVGHQSANLESDSPCTQLRSASPYRWALSAGPQVAILLQRTVSAEEKPGPHRGGLGTTKQAASHFRGNALRTHVHPLQTQARGLQVPRAKHQVCPGLCTKTGKGGIFSEM